MNLLVKKELERMSKEDIDNLSEQVAYIMARNVYNEMKRNSQEFFTEEEIEQKPYDVLKMYRSFS